MHKVQLQGICHICLRIDKTVHETKQPNLSQFYHEICNASEISLCGASLLCCMECEHRLRKMYNFKEQCVSATKILEGWRKMKHGTREPLHLIHKSLPQSTLDIWTPEKNVVLDCQHQESDPIVNTTDLNVTKHKGGQSSSMTNWECMHNVNLKREEVIVPQAQTASKASIETLSTKVPILCLKNIFAFSKDDTNIEEDPIKDESLNDYEESNSLDCEMKDVDNCEMKHIDDFSIKEDDDDDQEDNDSDTSFAFESELDISDLEDVCPKIDNDSGCSKNKPITISDHDYCIAGKERKNRLIFSFTELANESISNDDLTSEERVHQMSNRKIKVKQCNGDNETSIKTIPRSVLRKKLMNYCKKRLKVMVAEMFASCGELKAKDGKVIDKDFILSLMDNKMSETQMKTLWDHVYDKREINSVGLNFLKNFEEFNRGNDEYESVFDIVYLNTEEEVLQEFQSRKTYKCYTDAKYKCDICFIAFKYPGHLLKHQLLHEVAAGDYVCDICSKRFRHKKGLIAHRVVHEIVFKCKLCPVITSYRNAMINHYNQHKGVQYKCEKCLFTYRSFSSYTTHKNRCHVAPHVCIRCGLAFVSTFGLRAHTIKAHRGQPPLNLEEAQVGCPHCALTFPSLNVVKKHIAESHKIRRLRGTRGDTPREVTPKVKGPITCRVCNAVGRNRQWLNTHFLSDHPTVDMQTLYSDVKTHLCHVCGKGFLNKYVLKDHVARHTEPRPFKCPECPKRFQRAAYVKSHLLSHRPPQIQCSYCGKKYKTNSHLFVHMRIHIGDRRFKCYICGKGFLHSASVKEHIRGVHQKIRREKKLKPKTEKVRCKRRKIVESSESD